MSKYVFAAVAAAVVGVVVAAAGPGCKRAPRPGREPTLTKIAPGRQYDDGDVRIWVGAGTLFDIGAPMGPGHDNVSRVSIDIQNRTMFSLGQRPLWEHEATLFDERGSEYGTVVFSSIRTRTELTGGCHLYLTAMFNNVDTNSKTVRVRVPYKDVLLEFEGIKRKRADDKVPAGDATIAN